MAMFCTTVRCKEEYEMIAGTSTSCSAVCGGRANVHHTTTPSLVQRDLRHLDNRLGTGQHVELLHEFDDLFPPSAAQEHRESGPGQRSR